jgi:oxalate decarboxylase
VFLAIFKTDTYSGIPLSDWLTHTPPALVAAHFNLSAEDIAKFPNNTPIVIPSERCARTAGTRMSAPSLL